MGRYFSNNRLYLILFILVCQKCFCLTFPIDEENCIKIGERVLLTGWYTENRGTTQNARYHKAIDIPSNTYSPVRAVMSGKVIEKGFEYNLKKDQAYGNYIKIKDIDGFTWLYAHLTSYDVKNEEDVSEGQIIGTVGWTGLKSRAPHLHVEKRDNNNKKVIFTKDFGIRFSLRGY